MGDRRLTVGFGYVDRPGIRHSRAMASSKLWCGRPLLHLRLTDGNGGNQLEAREDPSRTKSYKKV